MAPVASALTTPDVALGASSSSSASTMLSVLHTHTLARTAVSITSGSGPVYAANDRGIAEISPRRGTVMRFVARIGAFGAQDVAVDDATGEVFATGVSDDRLYRVDPRTGTVSRSAPQSSLLGSVAVDPLRHRVLATLDTGLVAFDSRTLRVLWTVQVDGFPSDLAVDTSDGTALLATRDSAIIEVTVRGAVLPGLGLPDTALRVATDPARDTDYVGTYGGVDVIRHGRYVRTVAVRGDVADLTVDPTTGHAYAVGTVDGAIGHGYLTELDATHPRRLAQLRLAGGAIVVGRSAGHTFVGAYPSWRTAPTLYTVGG